MAFNGQLPPIIHITQRDNILDVHIRDDGGAMVRTKKISRTTRVTESGTDAPSSLSMSE